MDHLRVISEVRARNLADKHGLVYIETSASTGQNVRRSIDILLDKVMTRLISIKKINIYIKNKQFSSLLICLLI